MYGLSYRINNRGILISTDIMKERLDLMYKKLNKSLYILYDKNANFSPTTLSEANIRAFLMEEFPEDYTILLSAIDCNIRLDYNMLDYAYAMSSNKDFKDIVKVLHDYSYAKTAITAIETAVNRAKIKLNTGVISINPNIAVSSTKVSYRKNLDFMHPEIRKCIVPNEGYKIVIYSIVDVLMDTLYSIADVPKSDIIKYKKSNRGALTGLPYKVECKFYRELSSGVIQGKTKYGSILLSKIIEYHVQRDMSKESYAQISYLEKVYQECFDKRSDRMRAILNKHSDMNEYFMTDTLLMVEKQDSEVTQSKDKCRFNWDTLGNYCIDWELKQELPRINTILGVSGEYIKKSSLKRLGLVVNSNALPIQLVTFTHTRKKIVPVFTSYYSINDVRRESGESISPLIGTELQLAFLDLSVYLHHYNVSSQLDFLNLLMEYIKKPDYLDCKNVQYQVLVADLTLAMVYADCGVLDYNTYVKNKSFITDEIFYIACYDAEELFNKICLADYYLN